MLHELRLQDLMHASAHSTTPQAHEKVFCYGSNTSMHFASVCVRLQSFSFINTTGNQICSMQSSTRPSLSRRTSRKKHICIMQSTFEASCCDPKTLLGGAAIDAFAAVGCILFNYLVALPDLDQNEHKCIARIITPCMAPVQAIWQANITHG